MKNLLFIIAAMLMVGSAIAQDAQNYFTIDDFEVAQDQLGTNNVRVNVKGHFANYVSAWQVNFTYPEGITCRGFVKGSDLTLSYLDELGDEQSITPALIKNSDNTRCIVAQTEAAYDADGNYLGAAQWAPGEYAQMWQLVLVVAEDFAGGDMILHSECSSSGWADNSNICPKNTWRETTTAITVESPEPVVNNYFHADTTNVFRSDTVVIPVQLANEDAIIAFQTDIYMPEGFTIVTDEDEEFVITPSSRLTSDHIIMADQLNDGRIQVICYTPRSKLINGNDGDLFYITVAVPQEATGGNYSISLRNSVLTTSDYIDLSIPDAEAVLYVYPYIPGDANDSRTVTVTDIVVTAQYILERNPHPFIFGAADMNGDGNISVTDIMLIANLIMPPSMNVPKRMPTLEANSDRMRSGDITLAAGETRTVSILLDNELLYSAFQLDLMLPDGLTASNFALTDRAGNHTFDVNMLENGNIRTLCYSPIGGGIDGHEGALLTFEVTAMTSVIGDITVDGIELVTSDCQTVKLDAFNISVNNTSAVNELAAAKTVARIDYFNMAGQQVERPESGITLVVTSYTDGTRKTTKLISK